jgi:hypothetical protein
MLRNRDYRPESDRSEFMIYDASEGHLIKAGWKSFEEAIQRGWEPIYEGDSLKVTF